MTQNLTFTHIYFHCIADTPIHFPQHMAGNALRNGLAQIMRQTTCPEQTNRPKPTAEHAAICPACFLLAADIEPGTVTRGYALVPPLDGRTRYRRGDRFIFGITLFGHAYQFLPYFVLASQLLGENGVGQGRQRGNGRFIIEEITAHNPLTGQVEILRHAGERMVRPAELCVDWLSLIPYLDLRPERNEIKITFHTPTHLIEQKRIFRQPDFGVLFRRLLYRLDELNRQFANGERRDPAEVKALYAHANQVRMVDSGIEWHELWSYSSRTQRKSPVSGFLGWAVYTTDDWQPLLPWLIWGQAALVGKSTAKGCGVYQIEGLPPYWRGLFPEVEGFANPPLF